MSTLTGTGALARLILRRDRVDLPVWIAVFTGVAGLSASATADLYPTTASLRLAAETFNNAPALVALYGHVYDPTSLGAVAMLKMGGTGAIMISVFAIMLMTRHTRAEEETGRMELARAGVVGRHAPLAAAMLVGSGALLLLGVLTGLGLIAAGLPAQGSFGFGLAWAGVGIAFAAITAITAQLTTSSRAATGLSVVTLGVVYVVRAIGDTADATGPQWLTWLSPIGWGQQFRPYAGNRWWVLLITLGFALAATAAAFALSTRRDLGAGLLPDRPGPAAAAAGLRSPLALAWRLQRGTLLAWTAGILLLGLVLGNIASNVEGFLSSPEIREIVALLGGEQTLIDSYLVAMLGIMALIASAYAVQSTLRLRGEDVASRLEPLLAGTVSRVRWAGSHLVLALAGSALLMAAAGLGAGVAHARRVGDAGQIGRVLSGALVHIPAIWVLIGIVMAAFGIAARAAVAGWVALAGFILLGEVGPLLQLPQWIMDISPYTHVPDLPGGQLEFAPLAALLAAAVLLIATGLAAFRRRDI